MGMDRLLFFQENSEKLILGIFNSPISVFLAQQVALDSVFWSFWLYSAYSQNMHEKRSKINFFAKIRKLQKKLPFARKSLVGSRKSSRADVTGVEKKVKWRNRIFFGSHLERRTVKRPGNGC